MTTLPKGKQVIGIILRLAMASGMPTMVTAWAAAVVMCPMASHRPATRNHTMFMRADPAPALGWSTTRLPKGHSTYPAMRKQATPAGIVTMKRQAMTPARRKPRKSGRPFSGKEGWMPCILLNR